MANVGVAVCRKQKYANGRKGNKTRSGNHYPWLPAIARTPLGREKKVSNTRPGTNGITRVAIGCHIMTKFWQQCGT